MDLVAACRAFVSVSERGSFTQGAAAVDLPQSVASRRIMALESHLGGRLLDRSTRHAALTPFGRDMLPSAKRLVHLAEAFEDDADRAKRSPIRIAVPTICSTLDLARLAAAARRHGLYLEVHAAQPAERASLVQSREGWASLSAVPPLDATWSIPLGLASSAPLPEGPLFVETLRARRGRPGVAGARAARSGLARARIWVQTEDDVPHIRDRVTRLADSVGLAPGQLAVADTAAAAAEVLGSSDLLLCSARQAAELALHWRPLGEIHLVRGFDVVAEVRDDATRIRELLADEIAACLGVDGVGVGVGSGSAVGGVGVGVGGSST